MSVIRFDHVTLTYPGAACPVLTDVDLEIAEGELCLVIGETGSGKSTLLRMINGLVPHFTGGRMHGGVSVDGRCTVDHPPRELADVVGMVGQDPVATFVSDTVEEELAYSMECLALPPDVMRRRVEETLDLLGLTTLRNRALATLSGGEAQRVAIGAVLTAHPRILVLDEPTSALDPPAAEEVLAALHRLVHDVGITVVLAEHRLERVVHYADRIVYVADGSVTVGKPATMMQTTAIAPAIVTLGRWAGWSPLPLSIREARRDAVGLRDRLEAAVPAPSRDHQANRAILEVSRLTARHGATSALRGIDLTVRSGEIVGLMGRNGAGKSTLLGCIAGMHAGTSGSVSVEGIDPAKADARSVVRKVGLVPQESSDLLYGESVAEECATADRDAGLEPGTTTAVLTRLNDSIEHARHPRDLSEGQRVTLALAIVLGPTPPLIALDEPTRGLDYAAKARLSSHLRELASKGHAIIVATHDVEFAAVLFDRVVVVAEGEIVSSGPTREVVVGSPAFAPQVSKILAPLPWLSVDEVVAALETS